MHLLSPQGSSPKLQLILSLQVFPIGQQPSVTHAYPSLQYPLPSAQHSERGGMQPALQADSPGRHCSAAATMMAASWKGEEGDCWAKSRAGGLCGMRFVVARAVNERLRRDKRPVMAAWVRSGPLIAEMGQYSYQC